MSWNEPERHLAKIIRADIGEVYNGILGLVVEFRYGRSAHQCLAGYMLDAAMVARFMAAVGVTTLRKAEGKSCWVTATHDKILQVEPLHEDEGKPFNIKEWQEWVKAKMPELSWSDLVGDRR